MNNDQQPQEEQVVPPAPQDDGVQADPFVDGQDAAMQEATTASDAEQAADAAKQEEQPKEASQEAPPAAPTPEPAPAVIPEVVVPPAQPTKQIKVGTVVDPNQGKLGKTASQETVTRVTNASTAKPEVTTSAFEQKIQDLMVNGSTREKFVIASMQSYIDSISVGKPVPVDDGVRAQQSLYRTILNIVNSDEDFNNAFKLAISFVREHRKGVFADTHAFRFFEYAKPGQEWPNTLRNMLTLMIVASGVSSKKEVHKIVKISKAVQVGLTEPARQRVIQYFS